MDDLSACDILDLIPQRPPMVMADRLVASEGNTARTQLTVTESNLFVLNGRLGEAGLTEMMAQTAAAFTGYRNTTSGEPVREGYIAAIKNLEIHALPPVGSLLECRIIVENEIIGYTIITAEVLTDGRPLASGELRIITPGG